MSTPQTFYEVQKCRFLVDVAQYGAVVTPPKTAAASSSSTTVVALRRELSNNFAWTCTLAVPLADVDEQRRLSMLLALVCVDATSSSSVAYKTRLGNECHVKMQPHLGASSGACLHFTVVGGWRPRASLRAVAPVAAHRDISHQATRNAAFAHVKRLLRGETGTLCDAAEIASAEAACRANKPSPLGVYVTYDDTLDGVQPVVAHLQRVRQCFDACMHCARVDAPLCCSRCGATLYCDAACQLADWASHRSQCRAVRRLIAASEAQLCSHSDAAAAAAWPPRVDVDACEDMFARVNARASAM